MRCTGLLLGLVSVCAACQYEPRPVPGEPDAQPGASTGPSAPQSTPSAPESADPPAQEPAPAPAAPPASTPPASEIVAVHQCTSDSDCSSAGEKCALAQECFRSCNGLDCDSGCTGVCRAHTGSCEATPMPKASSCEGQWHIAWDEHGCPRPPVCLCPDGSPQPPTGGCATTCTAPVCVAGEALVSAAHCYQGCATACAGDGDCLSGERCLRRDSCAVVVCATGKKEDKDCREGRECFGVCVR